MRSIKKVTIVSGDCLTARLQIEHILIRRRDSGHHNAVALHSNSRFRQNEMKSSPKLIKIKLNNFNNSIK